MYILFTFLTRLLTKHKIYLSLTLSYVNPDIFTLKSECTCYLFFRSLLKVVCFLLGRERVTVVQCFYATIFSDNRLLLLMGFMTAMLISDKITVK